MFTLILAVTSPPSLLLAPHPQYIKFRTKYHKEITAYLNKRAQIGEAMFVSQYPPIV